MSLGNSLAAVIAAFVVILSAVVFVAFRERRIAQQLKPGDDEAARASDGRILVTIFIAIPGGMALMLVSAWLVFF
ncbi:MAG: hypothetical protein ABIQ72_15555 [Usitatibacter sp.]